MPLGPEGLHQAESLAARLAAEPIAAVYASPMLRTRETAAILALPHALPVRMHDGLREVDHGRWEGLRRADVEKQFPIEYASWVRDPLNLAPSGGEAGVLVMQRALDSLNEIVRAHAGRQVAVVSHKATIRLALAHLLGFDPRSYRDRLDQAPASLNVVDMDDDGGARLLLFNDVSHYAAGCERFSGAASLGEVAAS